MNKPIAIWQAIIATCVFLCMLGGVIVTQSNRITKDEAIILSLEKYNDKTDDHFTKTDQQFDKVNDKLEQVNTTLTNILVELQNKENRK